MKKGFVKKILSSTVAAALITAMLPMTMASAAVNYFSNDFETEAQATSMGSMYADATYSLSNVAYQGKSSLQVLQIGRFNVAGREVNFKVGKTYRARAVVKSSAPAANTKAGFSIGTYSNDYGHGTISGFSKNNANEERFMNAYLPVSDTNWHEIETTFVLSGYNTDVVPLHIGVVMWGDDAQTYYIDNFTVTEVYDNDAFNNEGRMAYMSFDGGIAGVTPYNGGGTIEQSKDVKYSGVGALKFTQNSFTSQLDFGTYTLKADRAYKISAYFKQSRTEDNNVGEYLSWEFQVPSDVEIKGAYTAGVRPGTSNEEGYRYMHAYNQNDDRLWRTPRMVTTADENQWIKYEYCFVPDKDTQANVRIWNVAGENGASANGHVIYVDEFKLQEIAGLYSSDSVPKYGEFGVGVSLRADQTIAPNDAFVWQGDNLGNRFYHAFGGYYLEAGKTYRASVDVYTPESSDLDEKGAVAMMRMSTKDEGYTHTQFWWEEIVPAKVNDWVTVTKEFTITEESAGLRYFEIYNLYGDDVTAGAANTAHTYYFKDLDVVEVPEAPVVPDITNAQWLYENAGTDDYATTFFGQDNAKKAGLTAGYGIIYSDVELNEGQDYIFKTKMYVEKASWNEEAEMVVYMNDPENAGGSHAIVPTNATACTTIKLTEDMTDKWIDIELPFTYVKDAQDTDGKTTLHLKGRNLTKTQDAYPGGTFYFADMKFVDFADIAVKEIKVDENGVVSYTMENAAGYMLEYEYKKGNTVIASGTVSTGEFLPKINTADLTATYTVSLTPTTSFGTKGATKTYEIEDLTKIEITDFELLYEDGYYISGVYNSTKKADVDARVIIAFYGDDGLLEVYQDVVTIEAEKSEGLIDFPPSDVFEAPEGTKTAKAFIWYATNNQPLYQSDSIIVG